MLVTASWVERVQSILGLQGVSQIWSVKPAWYFWLSDAPGPYELHLEFTSKPDDAARETVSAMFSVKLFPRPSGWAYSSFSPEEQRLASSDLFDETNTLRLEARSEVHPHLFTIATLGISLSKVNEAFGMFTLEAPEVSLWRTQVPRESLEEVAQGVQVTDTNGLMRNVPAWRLARGLFDCLVSLHAFTANTQPEKIVVTSSPGFEVVLAEDGTITSEDTPESRILTQSVLFGSSVERQGNAVDEVPEPETDDRQFEVLLDWKATCTCHNIPPTEASAHVSENWWHIAQIERISHHGSTCGCH